MKNKLLYVLIFVVCSLHLRSQEAKTAWDNTLDKSWPEDFERVEIASSFDGETQQAVFYKSPLSTPQPLIISLHTWSGDYLQNDPLANEIVLRGWNYIHPDFRGPNNRFEACGSEQAISDIEDAIRFAIKKGNVDSSEVHIIGVSGGGHASLMSFMKLTYPVKSFHAWAPVTNLESWYFECVGRGLKYARDLEQVTTGGNGFDVSEAQKRSPQLMDFPKHKRKDATLHIYTGIHDGYTGSVPVTHSINMYNSLASQLFPNDSQKMVSDSLKLVLLEKRMNPAPDTGLAIGDRNVHLYRELPNLSLTIFEGGHEMIVPQALGLLPVDGTENNKKLNILAIGDSNAAAKNGWPVQLRKLLPYSRVVNQSVAGNTIGFDNLNNPRLNTLKNIDAYLDAALAELPEGEKLDYIILGLGTNDAKKIFKERMGEVRHNMDTLLALIEDYFKNNMQFVPEIVVVSPPPMNEKIASQEKYGGGNKRIDKHIMRFKKLAQQHDAIFLNVNKAFKQSDEELTIDGVHLTSSAQFKLAQMIIEIL
ncbi:SGNH/GDSL hydrolase family protein [Sunxiuqinia rutila]|uniref:SGNH/GDSL hydrolase family protein n=1 Tax=Sunxiuqinia rutila TaxID=1397841 RepID=UPI003D35A248